MTKIENRRRTDVKTRRTEAETKKKTEEKAKTEKVAEKEKPAEVASPRPTEDSRRTARLAAQTDTRVVQTRTNLDRSLNEQMGLGVGASAGLGAGGKGGTTAPSTSNRVYQVPKETDFHPAGDESERTADVQKRQTDAVQKSLETGEAVPFENSEGTTVNVSVKKTENGYSYDLQGKKVDVTFDPSYSEQEKTESLAKLVDYHSQLPEHARDTVDQFDVKAANPESNTAADYNIANKRITFYGKEHLNESNFTHEVGHGVGYKLTGDTSPVPPGWDDAVSSDGNEISGYGKSSFDNKKDTWRGWLREKVLGSEGAGLRSDDFAESFAAYAEAKESGPAALREFEQKYPNRAKYLAQYFDTYRDSPMPQSDRQPVYA